MSPDRAGDGSKKADQAGMPGGGIPGAHLDASIQAGAWLALWEANDRQAVDISQIDIRVRQCEVWLSGQVEDVRQKCLAESLVKTLDHVKCCHNELKLISQPEIRAGCWRE